MMRGSRTGNRGKKEMGGEGEEGNEVQDQEEDAKCHTTRYYPACVLLTCPGLPSNFAESSSSVLILTRILLFQERWQTQPREKNQYA